MKPCKKCGTTDRTPQGRCRLCRKVSQAAYQKTHRAECNAALRKWRKANPDGGKATETKWRSVNYEKVKATTAAWQAAHPERLKEASARWRTTHPEKAKIVSVLANHKRRAQKKNIGGSFTIKDVRAMLIRQHGRCVVCRVNISKIYHIDHIMPLALGGSNKISNIQLLCPYCNRSKHATHPITFMQLRGFLL